MKNKCVEVEVLKAQGKKNTCY